MQFVLNNHKKQKEPVPSRINIKLWGRAGSLGVGGRDNIRIVHPTGRSKPPRPTNSLRGRSPERSAGAVGGHIGSEPEHAIAVGDTCVGHSPPDIMHDLTSSVSCC